MNAVFLHNKSRAFMILAALKMSLNQEFFRGRGGITLCVQVSTSIRTSQGKKSGAQARKKGRLPCSTYEGSVDRQ